MFVISEETTGLGARFGSAPKPGLEYRYLGLYRNPEDNTIVMFEVERKHWLCYRETWEILTGMDIEYRTFCPYPDDEKRRLSRDDTAYMCILHHQGRYNRIGVDMRLSP